MSNSIIDGQQDLSSAIDTEIEKCHFDEVYFFENYYLINGRKPTKYEVERFRMFLKHTGEYHEQIKNIKRSR